LEGSSWINIVALTPAGDIVLIRQFRHGTRSVTLEIPGGCIDESDASPLHAARRELLEETGFASDDWSEIGKVHPNPAIQANTCYTFLARNAVRLHEPQPDGTEDIYVELAPVENLDGLVLSGEITHGLVVVALHFFRLHREKAVA
jgi:8-oxo-dGTP pyrophosphatase MutT (NUDIX family)